MNLFKDLTAYFDKKFDRQYKTQNALIEQQNALLQGILDYVKGPANQEEAMGSAEEDGIDDSVGVYKLEKQTKDDLRQTWRDLGYPNEILKHLG